LKQAIRGGIPLVRPRIDPILLRRSSAHIVFLRQHAARASVAAFANPARHAAKKGRYRR
jgi:hypothetical protein